MTNFDYEILEAVTQHQDGIEQSKLENQYFKGYNLTYNLIELSKVKSEKASNGIIVAITNSAYLEAKRKSVEGFSIAYTFSYTITDRGKSMLANWQRRRAERAKEIKRREIFKMLSSILTGVITGIVATLICSKFLGI